jgi:hypothetical protein
LTIQSLGPFEDGKRGFDLQLVGKVEMNLQKYSTVILNGLQATQPDEIDEVEKMENHLLRQTINEIIIVHNRKNRDRLKKTYSHLRYREFMLNSTLDIVVFSLIKTELRIESAAAPRTTLYSNIVRLPNYNWKIYKHMPMSLINTGINKKLIDGFALLHFMAFNGIEYKEIRAAYGRFIRGRFYEHESMIERFIQQNHCQLGPFNECFQLVSQTSNIVTQFTNQFMQESFPIQGNYFNPYFRIEYVPTFETMEETYFVAHNLIQPLGHTWQTLTAIKTTHVIHETNKLRTQLQEAKIRSDLMHQVRKEISETLTTKRESDQERAMAHAQRKTAKLYQDPLLEDKTMGWFINKYNNYYNRRLRKLSKNNTSLPNP